MTTQSNPAAIRFDNRVNAIAKILDGNILVAVDAVMAADETAAHDEDAARDRAAAELAAKPIKWVRTYDGLASADGRFRINKIVEWILGTRCVSFSLYDSEVSGGRRVHSGRQAECKAIANDRRAA